MIKGYKQKIEKELKEKCDDVLELIDNSLLINSKNAESIVFFLKMKGDYFRYLGEFMQDRKQVIEAA